MRTTPHYLSSLFLSVHKNRGEGSVGALLYKGLQMKYSPCSTGLATTQVIRTPPPPLLRAEACRIARVALAMCVLLCACRALAAYCVLFPGLLAWDNLTTSCLSSVLFCVLSKRRC